MTAPGDSLAFLQHLIERFENFAQRERLNPRSSEAWLAKAMGIRACIRDLKRLRFIEAQARAIDAIYDERQDVIQLRIRVPDGEIDHREHFLKLRRALEESPVTEEAKGGA